VAQPTQQQMNVAQQRVDSNLWQGYTALVGSDVVTGAVPLHPDQKAVVDNLMSKYGFPPIIEPFVQVVLITDKGKYPGVLELSISNLILE
jgi:hypothetical protein